MLVVKNINQARPSKKLSDRFLGPFKVVEPVGHQAYRLKLLKTMKIHPVFHVSLLEPYHRREGEDPSRHEPPILVEDDSTWVSIGGLKKVVENSRNIEEHRGYHQGCH